MFFSISPKCRRGDFFKSVLVWLGSFHSWSFEQQKVKSETIAIKRMCEAEKRAMDFNLRSEVFKARLKAGSF